MEDTSQETNRPLLELMRGRSFKDWGEAPKYNKEYRLLRWPAPAKLEEPYRRHEDGRLIRTEVPMWLNNMRFERSSKTRNFWNLNRSGAFSNSSRDTIRVLMADIRNCMRANIPFKTKTYEYDPKTTTLYVGEKGEIRYSLETGRISSFTYGGVYDKRMSLMLRRFSIYVVNKRKRLLYLKDSKHDEIEIDLFDIVLVSLYDPYIGDEIRELQYVQGKGSTTINPALYTEFFSSINEPLPSNSLRHAIIQTGDAPRPQVLPIRWPANMRWQDGPSVLPRTAMDTITATISPTNFITTTIDLGESNVFQTIIQNTA